MGNTNKKQSKCLVVGLDNSGKSTLINNLKNINDRSNDIYATVGFQIEKFTHNKTNFVMFDMSGQSKYRNLWIHYIKDIQAIIYVIDSSDVLRLSIVKDELIMLLNNEHIKNNNNIVMLFYSNKMDLPKSLTPSQLSEQLGLNDLCNNKQWNIVKSNALTGNGVQEGINWLTQHMKT